MDDRVQRLERDVSDLRVAHSGLEVEVKNLCTQVHNLGDAVSKLNNTISEGKGALWVVRFVFGAIGAGAVWVLDLFKL